MSGAGMLVSNHTMRACPNFSATRGCSSVVKAFFYEGEKSPSAIFDSDPRRPPEPDTDELELLCRLRNGGGFPPDGFSGEYGLYASLGGVRMSRRDM